MHRRETTRNKAREERMKEIVREGREGKEREAQCMVGIENVTGYVGEKC